MISRFFGRLEDGNPGHDLILEVFSADAPGFWDDASKAVAGFDKPAFDQMWTRLTKPRKGGDPLYLSLNNLAGQRLRGEGAIPDHAGTLALLVTTAGRIACRFDPTSVGHARDAGDLDPILAELNAAVGNGAKLREPAVRPGTNWPDYLRERLWSVTTNDVPQAQFALWDAICQLWRSRSKQWIPSLDRHHVCRVPVVGLRNGGGFVATLELETLDHTPSPLGEAFPHSPPAVFHDPSQWLVVATDARFRKSMTDAWALAYDDFVKTNRVRPHVGRWGAYSGWSLEERNAHGPCRIADGPSAGGAALRGWRFALTRRFPPPEVLVISAVDASRGYDGLGDGLVAKVGHIAKQHAKDFETIVVATRNDAIDALDAIGGSRLRVMIIDDHGLRLAKKVEGKLDLLEYPILTAR